MVLTTVEETQAPEKARYLLARTQQQIADAEAGRAIIEMIATIMVFDILAAVKRTAIPHHATFLGWSLNGVDASPKNA
jgi:predicted transposase YdaD